MPVTRLLYVEDDEDHRDLLAAFLGASGFQVTTATTAAEASSALERDDFDLLLADVTLPDQDGWRVAELARVRQPGMRIVMLTGWQYSEPARGHGFVDEILTKPVTPLDLLSRLRSFVPAP
jgi:DNA-binding response OmpR family regulator